MLQLRLKESLFAGPKHDQNILAILLRFCAYRVAIMAERLPHDLYD